jgi:ferredoxin--NADP+ reductase
MFKIIDKKVLNSVVKKIEIEAPYIAKKAQPGQFIILRVNEEGERVPFTIAGYDVVKGTIIIIFQEIGKSTKVLGTLEKGDFILDLAGPLGIATHLDDVKKVAVVGGGLGTAIAWPQAKLLHSRGVKIDCISGFRNKELIILEEEMKEVSDRLYIVTDDGSNGNKGFVTNVLQKLIDENNNYDAVIAIGPLPMMKAVCDVTRKYNIKTIVSMNPIMVDGTGMCGGCRLTVGGVTKFACVDGPDFDGHEVDFDEAMRRSRMYKGFEQKSNDKHTCRLEELT